MTDSMKNDLFYTCSLIEYIARETTNTRKAIVDYIGEKGIQKLLKDASVNHCLTFEQVSEEIIETYHIQNGEYDTITGCKYTIPGYMDIGRLYAYMIEILMENDDVAAAIISVFSSFISNEISNFKTGIYFENLSYLTESYKAGYLLE